MSVQLARVARTFLFLFDYVYYLTSSNLIYTDNQQFMKVLVQIWNTISILDVVPSITIDKHPCDSPPILLCPFLYIPFFCRCKDTLKFSLLQLFVLVNTYISRIRTETTHLSMSTFYDMYLLCRYLQNQICF